MKKTASKGFTLIELLVVIAIIGLLSTVVVASLSSARSKARDAQRLASLNEMGKAVSLLDADPAVVFGPSTAVCATTAHSDASTCTTPAFGKYKDPSTPGTACTAAPTATCQYSVAKSDGTAGPTTQDYEICTYLENAMTIGGVSTQVVKIGSDTGSGVSAGCN